VWVAVGEFCPLPGEELEDVEGDPLAAARRLAIARRKVVPRRPEAARETAAAAAPKAEETDTET